MKSEVPNVRGTRMRRMMHRLELDMSSRGPGRGVEAICSTCVVLNAFMTGAALQLLMLRLRMDESIAVKIRRMIAG